MNVRCLILTLPATVLLALAGCAGSHASTRDEAHAAHTSQQGMQGMAAMCPMMVKDTKVEASDTEQGAALTFTTKGDVTELRRRVTAMADMHNAHHGSAGGCACGQEGGAKACSCPGHAAGQGSGQGGSGCACGQHEGQGCACGQHEGQGCACGQHEGQGCACGQHGEGMNKGMGMPASRATTEEVPDGIRLVLTPVDPAQRDALRESVRAHASMMSSGNCPMMKGAPAHHEG